MEQRNITLAGETFRLSYNIKTSLRLIEGARPDKSIIELLDSRRMIDKLLLLVAGLDEVHEKDKRKRLSPSDFQAVAERMTDLVEAELADSTADNSLDHVFLPVQRAIAESGITGRVFTYESPYVPVAVGKEPSTVAAT
jgi:hypothetical protein